jgi:transcriptional regulator CtsR
MDKTSPSSSSSNVEEYIQSLNAQEKQALEIAKDHLGSSFNITKSIGFIKWKEKIGKTE